MIVTYFRRLLSSTTVYTLSLVFFTILYFHFLIQGILVYLFTHIFAIASAITCAFLHTHTKSWGWQVWDGVRYLIAFQCTCTIVRSEHPKIKNVIYKTSKCSLQRTKIFSVFTFSTAYVIIYLLLFLCVIKILIPLILPVR